MGLCKGLRVESDVNVYIITVLYVKESTIFGTAVTEAV